MTKVALLGFGIVGSGSAEVLTKNKNIIEKKVQDEVEIKYILDLRDFPGSPFESLIVHDINIILDDPEVSVVAEMMGGSHPAFEFTRDCLLRKKSVVTANKELVSNFGVELLQLAEENNVSYLFEASVGGGIPVIRPMRNDLSSNNFKSVSGILNGTTNYILTRMLSDGVDYASVLSDAQKLGYAEANPTADVEGIDACRKTAILGAMAFGKLISPKDIFTEGITRITLDELELAKSLGYAVKLIGHTEILDDGRILAMTTPRWVSMENPLASVNDVYNGLLITGDMVGQVMFYGPGAGKLPTASAIVGDIIDIVEHRDTHINLPKWTAASSNDIANIKEYKCRRIFIFEHGKLQILDGMVSSGAGKENGWCICDGLSEAEAEKIKNDPLLGVISTYRIL